VVSTQQKTVVRVVRNLAIFNGVLIALLVTYALVRKMPGGDIIHLVLTAVLASIPVALPATFTLAAALGAKALARVGVLPTRLSAVDEAATLDVLCSDKTGTLTLNDLTVTALRPRPASMSRTSWRWPLSRAPTAGRIPWTPPSARPPRSSPSPIRRS
jgi:H+-transporting ATPase